MLVVVCAEASATVFDVAVTTKINACVFFYVLQRIENTFGCMPPIGQHSGKIASDTNDKDMLTIFARRMEKASSTLISNHSFADEAFARR